MKKSDLSRLHRRVDALAGVIRHKLAEANIPHRPMSKRERSDLCFILRQMERMLQDDRMETLQGESRKAEGRRTHEQSKLNEGCDFFDLDANRIRCAIGCDMFHCSRSCVYATNVPGSMPPYCTKYMKGWIEK